MRTEELVKRLREIAAFFGDRDVAVTIDCNAAADRLEAIVKAWVAWQATPSIATETDLDRAIKGEA